MKDLQLLAPEQYTFMASISSFILLGIPSNTLEQTTHVKSTSPLGTYITSLDTSLPDKKESLSLHCKPMKRVKNEVDG